MEVTFNKNIDQVSSFVRICERFNEDVEVKAGRYIVNGKSIMGVCSVSNMPEITAEIVTDSPDKKAEFEAAIAEYRVCG